MKKNKGFSLIELIVIIAIMSILTGILTPMFVKYANNKRQQACRQNREAILSIYQQGVYENKLQVESGYIEPLVAYDPMGGGNSFAEYVRRASDYWECPGAHSNTQYYSIVSGATVYVGCAFHDGEEDICVADFVGWTGDDKELKADIGFTDPTPTTTPVLTPTPTLPPKVENKKDKSPAIKSAWPYRYLENGEMDPRWTNVDGGISDNAEIKIPLPKYAHFEGNNGKEYFIMQGNDGNTCLRVPYKHSEGPEKMGQGFGQGSYATWVIALSGKKYVYWADDSAELPGKYSEMMPSENDGNGKYRFGKGDVVTVYFDYVYQMDENGNYKLDSNGDKIIDFSKTKHCDYICTFYTPTEYRQIPDCRSVDEWPENSDKMYYLPPIYEVDEHDWGIGECHDPENCARK